MIFSAPLRTGPLDTTPWDQKSEGCHATNQSYLPMVEKDHGVELDSAKVSALMVVPMMDFAYQLQTLASPRWVYSGET